MLMLNVTDLLFLDDTGTMRLDQADGWAQVAIGVNSSLNLVAEVEGADFVAMPETLPVDIRSHSPNRVDGSATLAAGRLRLDLRKTADLGHATRYELSKRWEDLPFKEDDSTLEVATVMRKGYDATAADVFRGQLRYTARGLSRQPTYVKHANGSYSVEPDRGDPRPWKEVPPSELVMKSGGVEILVAQVPRVTGRKVTAQPARALVRSPADIWFYSGHGLSNGTLAIGPLDETHSYLPWKDGRDFIAAWVAGDQRSRTLDMRMLIINGCNVLNLDPGNGAPGVEWAKLMRSRDGNLTHILGYAVKAPTDVGGGAAIAGQIGKAIREKKDPVEAWLDINDAYMRWGAAAMDGRGYHAFDGDNHRVTLPLP